MHGEVEKIVLAHELSNTSVASTTARRHGDAHVRKSARDQTILAQKWRTKARPRAFPPSDPEPMRRKPDSEGLKVSALKSPIRTSFCSRRYSWIDSIKSRRRCFGLAKSDTFRGRSLGRQGKLGPRHQPVGKVVSLAVIHDAFGRNLLQLVFESVSSLSARANFARIGQTKHKVAEARIAQSGSGASLSAAWANACAETNSPGMGPRTKLGAAGLQNDRDVRHQALAPGAPTRIRPPDSVVLPRETPRPTPGPTDNRDTPVPAAPRLQSLNSVESWAAPACAPACAPR